MHEKEIHLLQNNKFTLSVLSQEIKMSHWVDSPVITDTKSQEIILDLSNTAWHLVKWGEIDFGIEMTLAKYPYPKMVHRVDCNLDSMIAQVNEIEIQLSQLPEKLNQL